MKKALINSMIMFIFLLISFTYQNPNASDLIKDEPKEFDRDYFLGFWKGTGFICNAKIEETEYIEIHMEKDTVIAINTYGNKCVYDGSEIFRLTLPKENLRSDNFYIAYFIGGTKKNPNSIKYKAEIKIIDEYTFVSGKTTFHRDMAMIDSVKKFDKGNKLVLKDIMKVSSYKLPEFFKKFNAKIFKRPVIKVDKIKKEEIKIEKLPIVNKEEKHENQEEKKDNITEEKIKFKNETKIIEDIPIKNTEKPSYSYLNRNIIDQIKIEKVEYLVYAKFIFKDHGHDEDDYLFGDDFDFSDKKQRKRKKKKHNKVFY